MIKYYDNFYLTVTLLIDVHVFCVVFIFSFIHVVLVFITITNYMFMNNYHFRLRHMPFISFSF